MALGSRRWVAILFMSAMAGCYKPNIIDGGLMCNGQQCPDGFSCAQDHRCYSNLNCGAAPVTPLCTDDPASGQPCNPVCQTGCPCGRCNFDGTKLVCGVGAGPKMV